MHTLKSSIDKYSALFWVSGVLLGVAITLGLTMVRYTSFVPPSIVDIKSQDAYQTIVEHGDGVIFIDVRSEYEFAQAHASSSVNLPINYLYDDTHGLKNEKRIPLPKNTDQEIYLICTGGRLAGVAYSYLEHYGYRNIKRIEGGLKGWNDAGLPIVTKSLFDTKDTSTSATPSRALLDKPYVVK